jgi:polyisoprenyl-teichoic acid--peptidoglycan teichoic acid transferase
MKKNMTPMKRKKARWLGMRPYVAIPLAIVVLLVATAGVLAANTLSQSHFINIGIQDDVYIKEGSLDDITIPTYPPDPTQDPKATPEPEVTFPAVTVSPYKNTLPWTQGHSKVYVVPEIPIQRIAQKDPDVENILFFGVDTRSSSYLTSRADMLIVVTIDERTNCIKLTSIMRDTQVKIPGRTKPDKVNASYVYGGVGLLLNTINRNFDLDIQKFVMVDMLGAEQVIDIAGGVRIDVTEGELLYLNRGIYDNNLMFALISNPSAYVTVQGLQTLNGRQTVAYARIRKLDTEYRRTLRQRTVLEALLNKFWNASLTTKYNVLNKSLSCVETNMPSTNIISTAVGTVSSFRTYNAYRVPENEMFKTDYSNWNLVVDMVKQVPALHEFIWGQP